MSALSIKKSIKARDIIAVKKLDPSRPVYLLIGENSKIVIKRDKASNVDKKKKENDPRSMRHTFRNMTAVDKTIAARQLLECEVSNVGRYASELEHGSKNLHPFRWEGCNEDAKKLFADLRRPGQVWIKTDFFEGLVDLDSAASSARAMGKKKDKSGVRAVAAALSAPGGLEKLGQIIAVDAFNGNNDRFELRTYTSYDAKPKRTKIFDVGLGKFVDVETWRMVNAGNVAFSIQDSVLKPIGMDPWSSSSLLRNFETDEGPSIAELDLEWTGFLLKDDRRMDRDQIGFDIEDDLETLLSPRNRKLFFASKKRLPRNAGERITQGIEEGAQILKRSLLAKATSRRKLPPGLLKRMEVLGWGVFNAKGKMQPAPPKGRPPRRV